MSFNLFPCVKYWHFYENGSRLKWRTKKGCTVKKKKNWRNFMTKFSPTTALTNFYIVYGWPDWSFLCRTYQTNHLGITITIGHNMSENKPTQTGRRQKTLHSVTFSNRPFVSSSGYDIGGTGAKLQGEMLIRSVKTAKESLRSSVWT